MSAEWVTAIGTIGTFVVISASAIAALMQLRHMRGSNQIVALTECRETLESPGFREAQRFVSFELPKRLADPQERGRIAAPESQFEGEYQAIDTVGNFFESLGLFAKTGIIDRDLVCELWSVVILRNWNAMLPVITYVREDLKEPSIWENFEYIAWLCAQSMARRHGNGSAAPARLMPEDRSLIEAVRSGGV